MHEVVSPWLSSGGGGESTRFVGVLNETSSPRSAASVPTVELLGRVSSKSTKEADNDPEKETGGGSGLGTETYGRWSLARHAYH